MSDLAFPEITDVIDRNLTTRQTPPASLKETALASFAPIEDHLRTLAARFDEVAFDVATPKGMKDAKAARMVLRDEGRYAVQRLQKRLKDEANDLKRTLDAKGDELIAIIKPVEDAIHGQIEAEENRLEAIREEKARIERERIAALDAKLQALSVWIERCKEPGMTADRINAGINALADIALVEADWAEYLPRAFARRSEVLDVMSALRDEAAAREAREIAAKAERERLEAQRIENQRVAAENARIAAELKRQADELAAQRAESARLERLADERRAAIIADAEREKAETEAPRLPVIVAPASVLSDKETADANAREFMDAIDAIEAGLEAEGAAPRTPVLPPAVEQALYSLTVEAEDLGLVERLRQRTLPKHGGHEGDSLAHHWNLTNGDSELHAEAGKALQGLEHEASFYRRRCEAMQAWQSRMRDPERTVVCDILANGFTLDPPVPADRYELKA